MNTLAAPISTPSTAPERPGLWGHPKALVNLSGVEMWERFSYYGMQGILLLYLYLSVSHGGLGINVGVAVSLVGAYGGLVYLSTIFGAWLADRVFGSERTLLYSAILILIGHLSLAALPGLAGVGVGLAAIAFGSGGLKANTTTIIGSLYSDDARRNAGFAVFYLGINLGALIGPLLTGVLQSTVGFHYGFGAAAVGMALGLIQYLHGRRDLPAVTRRPVNPAGRSTLIRVGATSAAVLAVAVILIVTGVFPIADLSHAVAAATAIAAAGCFIMILTSRRITRLERRRVLAFVPLFVVSAAFWSLYMQQFTVLTEYSEGQLDRRIFGLTMPVSWVQSINPVFILMLSASFAVMWTKLGKHQPGTPLKFAAGTVVMGIAFLLFLPFSSDRAGSTPLWAMIAILFVFTIAELLVSPVGMAAATTLAPQAFKAQMVALFFLSVALGTAMSGVLSADYNPAHEGSYFGALGAVAVVIGLVLAVFSKPLGRLMRVGA